MVDGSGAVVRVAIFRPWGADVEVSTFVVDR